MICLCNPHNPLGKLYTREDLELLIDLADQHDLWIMNDEIWADIVFPGKTFHSIVTVGENRNQRVLSVMGFSKSFGLAGLRAGAIYCHDKEIFDKLVEKSDVMTTAGGITSLSQIAGMACLNKCYYWVDAFIKHLTANRDYAIERLNSFKNISCHKPDATFVLFPDISATGLTSEQFADHMMNEVKLAIVPGTDKFFGPGAEGHVRICFSTSFDILKEGLDRFEKGLSRL
jgi:aspartate/methionine/tyrosine aminotransferase